MQARRAAARRPKARCVVTDARIPDRWPSDRRFRRRRLSDPAYRSYMQALTWSVTNRTEGVIEPGDLSDIADFDVAAIRELTGGDLWEPRGPDNGWLIIDFQQTQTGRDLLESYDRKERGTGVAKRRHAKRSSLCTRTIPLIRTTARASPVDVPVDIPPDKFRWLHVGKARPGKARHPRRAPAKPNATTTPNRRGTHMAGTNGLPPSLRSVATYSLPISEADICSGRTPTMHAAASGLFGKNPTRGATHDSEARR